MRALIICLCIIALSACGGTDQQASKKQTTATATNNNAHANSQDPILNMLKQNLGDNYNKEIASASEAQLQQGHQIYQQRCAGCHGTIGKGDGMLSKHLKPAPTNFTDPIASKRYSDQGRMYIIKHGLLAYGAQMMPFKDNLSDDEVFAVYSYTKSLIKE